jgi:hypothetical protein
MIFLVSEWECQKPSKIHTLFRLRRDLVLQHLIESQKDEQQPDGEEAITLIELNIEPVTN